MSSRRYVLTDTGPLYAALDHDDEYHHRAQKALAQLALAGRQVVVLFPTLMEGHRLILSRFGSIVANEWIRELRGRASQMLPQDDEWVIAAELIGAYPDQPLTFHDVLLATVSKRTGFPVWSYDHHMDVLGVSRWYGDS